jgi:hypothetical protein
MFNKMWHELRLISYTAVQTDLVDIYGCRKLDTGIKLFTQRGELSCPVRILDA